VKESCGKTTLVKYLAKIFHTSWSEEWGRHYPDKYLGGNDKLLATEDFFRIAFEQQMQDEEALKSANRVAFFDSDAVVTQFYCKMYTGSYNKDVERFVDPDKYDAVILLPPSVQWVSDGMRWKNDQRERERLHEELRDMYAIRGFERVICIVEDTYESRLDKIVQITDKMLADRHYLSRV